MSQQHFTQDDVMLARLLHEDDAFMILEVPKDLSRKVELQDGDQFFTIIFTGGKPWEK